VLLVKDTKRAHQLYEVWHRFWKDGIEIGLKIDQPSLAKANREVGHIIEQIPDTYNCIVFTRPIFVRDAHILHIASYQNPSFLFTERVLNYVRENGLENEWLRKMILNPCATMMPFDYNLKHSTYKERRAWRKELAEAWSGYGEAIDAAYADFPMSSWFRNFVVRCIKNNNEYIGMLCWFIERRLHIININPKINACQK